MLPENCHEPKFHKKFRRRFRMSYESYLKHLIEVKESPLFKQWSDDFFDCVGNKSPTQYQIITARVFVRVGIILLFRFKNLG